MMQFQTEFQYWFCLRNELYQQHVIIKPVLWRWILWTIGILDLPYTEEEMYSAADALLSSAIKSIDELLAMSPEQAREAREKKRKNPKCIWMARRIGQGEEEKVFMYCVLHNIYSHSSDVTNPYHDEQEQNKISV